MVNGINTLSNSHSDGARSMATGKLEMGFPALANCWQSTRLASRQMDDQG